MSSDFGKYIHYSFFGQPQSEYIGITINGLPAGEYINPYDVREFIARQAPGESRGFTVQRFERDEFQFLSGIVNDVTCGSPLCAVIPNDTQKDEDETPTNLLRPSTGDYTARLKYHGFEDPRGGGPFSGRIAAAICLGGAIAKTILEKRGVVVGAHIESIGKVQDKPFDPVNVTADQLKDPGRYPFPTLNFGVGETMQAQINLLAKKGDSIGGVIEAGALGIPGGVGDPLFDGMENLLAKNLFGIPGVKGVEFGEGFRGAEMKGSEHNDEYYLKDGNIKTKTNHAGGILGGVTTGMPLILRIAVKPTPSIDFEQDTVDIETMEETTIITKGRHDACIVPRIVPVAESVIAMTLLDVLMGESDLFVIK